MNTRLYAAVRSEAPAVYIFSGVVGFLIAASIAAIFHASANAAPWVAGFTLACMLGAGITQARREIRALVQG